MPSPRKPFWRSTGVQAYGSEVSNTTITQRHPQLAPTENLLGELSFHRNNMEELTASFLPAAPLPSANKKAQL